MASREMGARAPNLVGMRPRLVSVWMLLIAVALTGCGGGTSSPVMVSPAPSPPPASSPVAVRARGSHTLGEIQFSRDATLRANLFTDVIVDRLEAPSSQPEPGDTGTAGVDAIPFRLAASTPFTLGVDSPDVDHVEVRDSQGGVRATARSASPATVSLAAGDYTLVLYSAGLKDATVFVRLQPASALPYVSLSALPPAVTPIATGVPAFVGDIGSGPLNEPVSVASWGEFVAHFGGLDPDRPTAAQVYQYFNLGGQQAYVVRVAPEPLGGAPALASYDAALTVLENVPAFDLLLVPDVARPKNPPDTRLAAHAVTQAQALQAFVILEVPAVLTTPADAVAWWDAQTDLHSTWAAAYYGQITAVINTSTDPAVTTNTTVTMGPGGTMAGFFAYTDQQEGVWNAPVNGLPPCDITAAPTLTLAERATLATAAISPLFMLEQAPFVGGARTAAGRTSRDFMYVEQRRLYIYVVRTINRALEWTVFAPNDNATWATAVAQTSIFMTNLWAQGALMGDTPAQAYSVLCGLGSTMTSNDILNGYLMLQGTYQDLHGVFYPFTVTQMLSGT